MQRWRVTGVRAKVFERLAEMLGRDAETPDKSHILDVVRPLCRFASSLNDYARYTKQLSDEAIQIRSSLLQAREPDRLLFDDLPRACGFKPFKAKQRTNGSDLDRFVGKLRAGLSELQQCYDVLLADIGHAIGRSFGFDASVLRHRHLLADRGAALEDWVADPKLKSFVLRISDRELDDAPWLESVAALLGEKPPAAWRDDNRARFEVGLAKTARLFNHVEALAFAGKGAKRANQDDEAVRVGITTRDSPEAERVVRIPAAAKNEVDKLERAIRKLVDKSGSNGHSDLAIAALARVTKHLLK